MSQHDFTIDNQSAPAARADINSALQALVSQNSGPTAPATTFPNMLWYDTANDLLKMRNESNSAWITLGTVDQTNAAFNPNFTPASQAEAEAGTENTKGMTPLRTAQAIAILGGTSAYTAFTASGTWTKPSNLKADQLVIVEAWGGGGGGASSSNSGGGGGGGYARGHFRVADLPSSVAVSIGAGGGINGMGGNTTFGSLLTAYGGGGGGNGIGGSGGGELTAGTMGSTVNSGGRVGGGDGGNTTNVTNTDAKSIYGGAGSTDDAVGGYAVYGGGGGGGSRATNYAGGKSVYGGNGGASGVAGTAPGGGGGKAALGARGEVRVWVV